MNYRTKTKEEIIAQTKGSFVSAKLKDDYWDVGKDALDYTIIYMDEQSEGYEGSAFGLATKDGELYEFESSHCSCDGFDFSPVPCDLPALAMRSFKGFYYLDKDKLRKFIGAVEL